MSVKISSLVAVAALFATGPALAAPLSVLIDGVEARGGVLYVSVQNADQFMQDEGTDGQVIPAPAAGTLSLDFDVAPGKYAITVWHDDNGDGTFNTAEAGMPLDGWAMSGPALRGAPTFDAVAIEVGGADVTSSLVMTYPRAAE